MSRLADPDQNLLNTARRWPRCAKSSRELTLAVGGCREVAHTRNILPLLPTDLPTDAVKQHGKGTDRDREFSKTF